MSEVTLPEPDRPWLMRTYSGHSTAKASQRAVPHQPGQGPDRPVDRLRPAHPDRLRPRRPAGPGRGRQGRRARRPPRPHGRAARRHPAGRDEHVDDDQRHRGVAARPVRRQRRAPRRRSRGSSGARRRTTSSRSTCPAAPTSSRPLPSPPADRRHGRLLRRVHPEVEPDERVLLPPAGGGGDAGPGDRLLRSPPPSACSTRCASPARCPRTASRRCSPRSASSSTPGIRFVEETCKMRAFGAAVGPHRPRALRRHRRQGPALPLRRAGQLPRPHRGPAREQRAAHRARDAGRHARRDARARSIQLPAWNEALGLPRPWDQQWSLRIQQVLAFETDLLEYDDLFDGSHVVEARTAELVDAATAELDDVLALGGAFEAIDELKGRLVAQPHRADAPHRVRRADRGRRQPLHRDRAVPAAPRATPRAS